MVTSFESNLNEKKETFDENTIVLATTCTHSDNVMAIINGPVYSERRLLLSMTQSMKKLMISINFFQDLVLHIIQLRTSFKVNCFKFTLEGIYVMRESRNFYLEYWELNPKKVYLPDAPQSSKGIENEVYCFGSAFFELQIKYPESVTVSGSEAKVSRVLSDEKRIELLNCSDQIKDLMKRIFNDSPEMRPTIQELKQANSSQDLHGIFKQKIGAGCEYILCAGFLIGHKYVLTFGENLQESLNKSKLKELFFEYSYRKIEVLRFHSSLTGIAMAVLKEALNPELEYFGVDVGEVAAGTIETLIYPNKSGSFELKTGQLVNKDKSMYFFNSKDLDVQQVVNGTGVFYYSQKDQCHYAVGLFKSSKSQPARVILFQEAYTEIKKWIDLK